MAEKSSLFKTKHCRACVEFSALHRVSKRFPYLLKILILTIFTTVTITILIAIIVSSSLCNIRRLILRDFMQCQLDFLKQWFNYNYQQGRLTIEYCQLHMKTLATGCHKWSLDFFAV